LILLDANILLYSYDSASASHVVARDYLERSLSGRAPVGLAWQSVVAFLRVATNPRIRQSPMSMREATGHVHTWLGRKNVTLLEPGPRHWEILAGLLIEAKVAGNLVSDAHLAAIAIEHGATLMSSDHDFARFRELAWKDPLAGTR
jgi:uncharacterized protein